MAALAGAVPAKPEAFAALPHDLQREILLHLSTQELASAARVSKAWKLASESDKLWRAATARDFGVPDAQTLAVLRQRAGAAPNPYCCQEKLVHRSLASHHTCGRCQTQFHDGRNAPGACHFHTGVLFSGGLFNGAALRWTCCNSRAHHISTGARDANGCKAGYHTSAVSAWEAAGCQGTTPRLLPPAAPQHAGSQAPGRAGGQGKPPGRPCVAAGQEWHPHHRPGLIELPSRLLLSF